MKSNIRHIIFAWALLLSFVTGQYMVYAHQHNLVKNTHTVTCKIKHTGHETVQEKCQLCDSMHHLALDVTNTQQYRTALDASHHVFFSPVYNFKSFSLILASGRAPPFIS